MLDAEVRKNAGMEGTTAQPWKSGASSAAKSNHKLSGFSPGEPFLAGRKHDLVGFKARIGFLRWRGAEAPLFHGCADGTVGPTVPTRRISARIPYQSPPASDKTCA